MNRSEDTKELIKRPHELALLALIAMRARRKPGFSVDGLKIGEALIGDFMSCGLTRQEYRTALKNLKKWNFLTTKSTNKGTVAKIIKSSIFDINIAHANQQANHQLTTGQPSANHQLTTNKKERKKEGKKKTYSQNSIEFRLANHLFFLIKNKNPNHKNPDIQKWAVHVDRMIRIDKRDPDQIRSVIEWCQNDDFWFKNILSTEKLRVKFDQLYLSMGSSIGGHSEKLAHARCVLEYDGEEACQRYCLENKLNYEDVH